MKFHNTSTPIQQLFRSEMPVRHSEVGLGKGDQTRHFLYYRCGAPTEKKPGEDSLPIKQMAHLRVGCWKQIHLNLVLWRGRGASGGTGACRLIVTIAGSRVRGWKWDSGNGESNHIRYHIRYPSDIMSISMSALVTSGWWKYVGSVRNIFPTFKKRGPLSVGQKNLTTSWGHNFGWSQTAFPCTKIKEGFLGEVSYMENSGEILTVRIDRGVKKHPAGYCPSTWFLKKTWRRVNHGFASGATLKKRGGGRLSNLEKQSDRSKSSGEKQNLFTNDWHTPSTMAVLCKSKKYLY